MEVRKLLMESLGQIDPKQHVRSNQVRATLDGLQNRVDLLPENDRVTVLAAIRALQSVEGGPPSAYPGLRKIENLTPTVTVEVRLLDGPDNQTKTLGYTIYGHRDDQFALRFDWLRQLLKAKFGNPVV